MLNYLNNANKCIINSEIVLKQINKHAKFIDIYLIFIWI